jgi:hypothetical protein
MRTTPRIALSAFIVAWNLLVDAVSHQFVPGL